MMCEDFKDIAPFEDSEFQEKMAMLVKDPKFEHAVRYVMPDVNYPEFIKSLLCIENKADFQRKIMTPFLEMLVAKTTSGISIDGLDNIEQGKNYTFITNHRDIVIDASFLNLCFIRNGLPTTEIAIGDNLLIYEWIDDLVRLNKCFIVRRNLSMFDAFDAAKQLSGYIHYALSQKHESVWIAQREGRAKDSNDVTQGSVIKMMGIAGGGSTLENIMSLNLKPVSISYEYDPNDYLKASEFLLRHKDPQYKKSQRDDLFSMETGLLQFKGRVHFNVNKCINKDLSKLTTITDRAENVEHICHLIDKAIHSGYRIYPINYIAYDELSKSNDFAQYYTPDDIQAFDQYIEGQLAKVELTDLSADDLTYMRQMMLTMYANPLKNKLIATSQS